jgi:hypothetical protein
MARDFQPASRMSRSPTLLRAPAGGSRLMSRRERRVLCAEPRWRFLLLRLAGSPPGRATRLVILSESSSDKP